MPYLIPILYVIVSYTFFLLPGLFDQVVELQIISALLPFLMGVVNLIVVLTVGRKWSRKNAYDCYFGVSGNHAVKRNNFC